MQKHILTDKNEMGKAAAESAGNAIKRAIAQKGKANIILATGASQFTMLEHLTQDNNIDWSNVTMFHLDEYVGLNDRHPASFVRYLRERFVEKVDNLAKAYFIDGAAQNPEKECERVGELIKEYPIDVACVGIGENGHLAFNDPPADFVTHKPFIVVTLDEACRKQQYGEGWFTTFAEVPKQAISMTVNQIMASQKIICSVPDKRKAKAVAECVQGPVINTHPASILQTHPDTAIFLDTDAASMLTA